MAHHSKGYFSKFMLCFFIFMIMFEFSIGDEVEVEATTAATVDDHQEEKKPVGVATEYWEKAKLLFQHTHGGNEDGEGAAVGKSTEKSKSTVGESAKTAEDTLHKSTDTVKKATGLSSSEEDKIQTQPPHPEL